MLTIDRVSTHFGGVYANQDVSLEVAEGELRGVIGPNGAGKSTLFNLIAGHLRPDAGSIRLDGTQDRPAATPRPGAPRRRRSCSRAPGCSRACACWRT